MPPEDPKPFLLISAAILLLAIACAVIDRPQTTPPAKDEYGWVELPVIGVRPYTWKGEQEGMVPIDCLRCGKMGEVHQSWIDIMDPYPINVRTGLPMAPVWTCRECLDEAKR